MTLIETITTKIDESLVTENLYALLSEEEKEFAETQISRLVTRGRTKMYDGEEE